MKKIIILLCVISMCSNAFARWNKAPKNLDFDALNKRAAAEYLIPIRPGYEGKNPYWNGFAFKFMFAPCFEFEKVKGAQNYRFTVKVDNSATEKVGKTELKIINNTFDPVSFTAESPNSSLAPIWEKIPAANVILTVEALNKKGEVIKVVGEKKFLRDFPFHGPYNNAVKPYKEAAIKGMLHIHNMPEVKCWADSATPNMTYAHYTYLNKCVSAVIRNEAMVAKYVPKERDKAIKMAENVAKFIISLSQPADAALPYFPPTYYKNLIASKRAENQGTTMTLDALMAAHAFLDLYDMTHNKLYFDRAINIVRTYQKLQHEDGSLPIKVEIATGKPVSDRKAMLHPLCVMIQRLKKDYNVNDFDFVLEKAEKWMHDVAIKSFDMTGQFEDVTVVGIKPYNNLTNCTSAPYARFLCLKDTQTAEELQDAKDLLRLSEDQFTYWDFLYNELGYRRFNTPCVIEQYHYRVPVDNSAANVSGGFLAYYKATGDELAFAKAKAIIDNITIQQVQKNGYIPTTWNQSLGHTNELSMWLNCAHAAIERLMEMSELCE